MPILDRIPDISITANASATVQSKLGGLLNVLGALETQGSGSPMTTVVNIFSDLHTRLDIDASPLTNGLTTLVQGIHNALPHNTLAFVESIEAEYEKVTKLLAENDIARQVTDGRTLNDVAQAVIQEALAGFEQHVGDLTDGLLDHETLEQWRAALAAIQQFEDDFASHQANLLPFLTRHLLGVAPDLLDAPLAHVHAVLNVLAPLRDNALATVLDQPRQAIVTAYRALLTALNDIDPADAAVYAQIQAHLDALDAANHLLISGLSTLYSQFEGLIAHHAWDALFTTYVDLLEVISIGDVPTLDDVVRPLESMLNELLSRVSMVFDGEDLRQRIGLLSRTLRDAVLTSPLGQIRQALQSFLNNIRQTIEAVPTENVQHMAEQMLGKVQEVIAGLDIGQLHHELAQALANVEAFVKNHLNDALKNNIQTALSALVSQLNNLPLNDLLNDLNGAIGQLQGLLTELENAVQGQINSLTDLLRQAENLSYRPVSDAAIGEIDDLKARLQTINPNALSDAEKLALKAALAVLEAIHLEDQVVAGLKQGYHAAEAEVKNLLNQITAALTQLRDQFGAFNPEVVLQPINTLLGDANALLDRLNARILLGGLHDQLQTMERTLQQLTPGDLLKPLEEPFALVIATLNRLDPTTWLAPLNTLYDQIDRVIDLIDIVPVLTDLDRKQRELLTSVRTTILTAFDQLDLPEPLKGFFADMRPLLELVTEAIFGDPDTQLKQISLSIRDKVNLETLFVPLDAAFLRLVHMVETVPDADLTAAMNTIRQTLGTGMEVLNPQSIIGQLRAGYGRLQELAPANLLAQTINLLAVKATFTAKVSAAPPDRHADVLAVSARFDAVFRVVSPTVSDSQLQQLTPHHQHLLNTLRQRINGLDSSEANQRYAQLRTSLERLLPDFLLQPTPLTQADILDGLYRMRPSSKAARLEETLNRFLQQLKPQERIIEPAIDEFFGGLRQVILLINPLTLRDDIEAIYAVIRTKVRILDPEQLATAISALFDPVKEGLQAFNPATIKEQLDTTFNNVVYAVTVTAKQILDELVDIIDAQLRTLRATLKAVLDQLQATITGALNTLKEILKQLEDLVFVELLDRFGRVIDNLDGSFDRELARVANAFDQMLAAIPLDGGRSESTGLSLA
jgi:hypothetical protein